MNDAGAGAMNLPVLRPDVEFHRGPDETDGAPTYVLHDPLRGTFEKLTWVQAEVLGRLRMPQTVDRLLEDLGAHTTIKVNARDVFWLSADASARGLTMDACVVDEPTWEQRSQAARPRGVATAFRRLAFMRIPLIRPDAFLTRTVGVVSYLGRPVALASYLTVSLIGLVFLLQRFDEYVATFPYFFNAAGVAAFVGAIAAVKVVHEFSHAYVAKVFGVRVPTMGVALIFLFPVAFADVTDSWRMKSRRKRLLISLAGVLAELTLAGLALFVWGLSSGGVLKSLCFVLSSVTLASTLLVNLNPVMRFDGYYVLSDLLGLDNLQGRSFAVMRWALRRHVLGMDVPVPEPGLSRGRITLLAAYAAGAWTYRFFLYIAIAAMLYSRVTKVIGVLLFIVAIHTFLVRPVVSEMISIYRMRARLSWNRRAVMAFLLVAALVGWAAWPLPRWRSVPATTAAANSQVVYAPADGVLRGVFVALGDQVRAGQPLVAVDSHALQGEASLAQLDVERLAIELALIRQQAGLRALLPQKLEELARAEAKQHSVVAAIEGNCVQAEVDGRVLEWDDSVRVGTPVGERQVLGRIVDTRDPKIVCYVPHDLIADISVGQSVHFCSDADPGRATGRVTFVDTVRANVLEQRGLASVAGGDIAVVPDRHGRLEVVDSYYKVEVALEPGERPWRVGQTGQVWLRTRARSRLVDLLRHVHRVLVRESSF